MLKEHEDAYGQLIYAFLNNESEYEIVERDDGFIGATEGSSRYFAEFEEWHEIEKEAIQYAHGRILDVGCGAGRVGLYLEGKGFDVLGIDNSPMALEVCKERGFTNVRLTPITKISAKLGKFDTIVMYGNNFGLFGNFYRAKYLLKRFHKITSPQARIIAQSNDVYKTNDPVHLTYQEHNRQRGRMSGQIRLRVRFRKYKTPWFDYLMVSPDEMVDILDSTGWYAKKFIHHTEAPIYAAIIEKTSVLR